MDDGEVQFKCFDEKMRFLQDVELIEETNRTKCAIDGEGFFTFTKDTWVADSGPSSHITNNDRGLKDVNIINDPIHGTMGKTPVEHSSIIVEHLFLDISAPTVTSLGGKWHWLLVVDDKSDNPWGFFLMKKSDLSMFVMVLSKL